ncbi:Holliday junction resolvasome RuvABC DNA-binding subunit, partial [Paenibacillus polymyxa]
EYLRSLVDRDMLSQGQWGNEACLGYAILAAKQLGYTEEQTEQLVRAIYREFDIVSVSEARKEYTGKLSLPLKTMGRPSIGITRKVSLTMSKKMWEHLDAKSKENRSGYLRSLVDRDMSSQGQWGNEACLGYAILAAKRLGYPEELTERLVLAIYREFDIVSVSEARKEYDGS